MRLYDVNINVIREFEVYVWSLTIVRMSFRRSVVIQKTCTVKHLRNAWVAAESRILHHHRIDSDGTRHQRSLAEVFQVPTSHWQRPVHDSSEGVFTDNLQEIL